MLDANASNSYRNDLEFFIPQICSYLVYHNELRSQELIEFLIECSKLDFYFAHQFYFYLNSLSAMISKNYIEKLEQ